MRQLLRVLTLATLWMVGGCDNVSMGTDAGMTTMTDGGDTDAGPGTVTDGGGTDAGTPTATLVDVNIRGSALLANNYPQQILPLFRASFTAGSGMGRLQLFARFCRDAACAEPIAVVPAVVDGVDGEGLYVFSTASTTGAGFAKDFLIPEAPAGSSFMQLIGDTERSRLWGQGTCTGLADCPGDADVVQMSGFVIETNTAGGDFNPDAASIPVDVTAGGTIELPDTIYLGHLVFDEARVAGAPAPSDDGTLLAAISNSDVTYRNYMARIALTDPSAHPGEVLGSSYVLQEEGSDYLGDVCGLIRGDDSLYAIGVNIEGTSIFELGLDGTQASDAPLLTIPPTTPGDASTLPYLCRGLWQRTADGEEHLYLIQFKGAGSNDNSSPHPVVHVELTRDAGVQFEAPFDGALSDHALRALVALPDGDLVAVDTSWSAYANNHAIDVIRLIPIGVDADGALGALGAAIETTVSSDETCGSTASYPSGAAVLPVGGTPRLLLGHDTGLVVYDVDTLTPLANLDLLSYGQLFNQFAASSDGTRIYALPHCKTFGDHRRFELPIGESGTATEASDTNLVAVLDATGSSLAPATTSIDIDGDGTFDDGIDMDYYRLKAYIRDFSGGLSIPPVVYTAPQMVVGEGLLFVRGSGSQSDGMASSGLGQVQDIGFFDLATGQGAVFGGYMPWFDGLSSEAGTGTGIWGYDVWPGSEASVGAMMYLPR